MWSIIISLIAGWILLIAITFAISNYNKEIGALVPPAAIFIDAIGRHGGETFNYAIVAVGAVTLFSGLYWLKARKWFTGPKIQGTAEELAAIEAELEAV